MKMFVVTVVPQARILLVNNKLYTTVLIIFINLSHFAFLCRALKEANITPQQIDCVCYTKG